MMSAGDLNRTISFLSLNAAQDSFGQPIEAPTVVRTVRAARRSLTAADFARGMHKVEAQMISDVADAKYETRYYSDVTTAMKLREGTRDYYITSVEEVGMKEGLIILCKVAL